MTAHTNTERVPPGLMDALDTIQEILRDVAHWRPDDLTALSLSLDELRKAATPTTKEEPERGEWHWEEYAPHDGDEACRAFTLRGPDVLCRYWLQSYQKEPPSDAERIRKLPELEAQIASDHNRVAELERLFEREYLRRVEAEKQCAELQARAEKLEALARQGREIVAAWDAGQQYDWSGKHRKFRILLDDLDALNEGKEAPDSLQLEEEDYQLERHDKSEPPAEAVGAWRWDAVKGKLIDHDNAAWSMLGEPLAREINMALTASYERGKREGKEQQQGLQPPNTPAKAEALREAADAAGTNREALRWASWLRTRASALEGGEANNA